MCQKEAEQKNFDKTISCTQQKSFIGESRDAKKLPRNCLEFHKILRKRIKTRRGWVEKISPFYQYSTDNLARPIWMAVKFNKFAHYFGDCSTADDDKNKIWFKSRDLDQIHVVSQIMRTLLVDDFNWIFVVNWRFGWCEEKLLEWHLIVFGCSIRFLWNWNYVYAIVTRTPLIYVSPL